jgi:hypothetical protein
MVRDAAYDSSRTWAQSVIARLLTMRPGETARDEIHVILNSLARTNAANDPA